MKKLCGAGNPPQISKGNNLGRPFGGGDVVGGCAGPTGSNSGGANEAVVLGPTHHDGYHHLLLSSPLNSGAQNPSIKSHPLGIFDSYSTDHYKSPVGKRRRMNSDLREMVPFFTSAQWKELERQAMIYKYMISSVPVPSHLLYPPISSMYNNVGYTKNGGALEPGRCKRTDGKKWRCSRDVAPHQKYCERHLHRGRPRSRKPVELNSSNIINGDPSLKKQRLQKNPRALLSIDEEIDPNSSILTAPCDVKINGDLSLVMENDAFSIKGSSIYIPKAPVSQDFCYTVQHELNPADHQILSHSDFPIDLVGSWSIDNLNGNTYNVHKYSPLSIDNENLSPWLNLSMGMTSGLALDQEICNADTRDCVEFYDEGARWPGPFCYSELFGLGGPLAEALGPSPTSPHDSVNGPGSAISSPSGGIQRTLSHSDGSVSNSPSAIGLLRIK